MAGLMAPPDGCERNATIGSAYPVMRQSADPGCPQLQPGMDYGVMTTACAYEVIKRECNRVDDIGREANRRSYHPGAYPTLFPHIGTRPYHRSVGRRPLRHWHLCAGRGATRIRHRMDDAADLSPDGGHSGDQRTHWTNHGPRDRGKLMSALSKLAPAGDRRSLVPCQYDQHRRRPQRHGGCDETPDRRPEPWLRDLVQHDLRDRSRVHPL